ncbi:MAG TPA: hypothetical protein VF047_03785 [Nitrososphaeraceae archaeon]
MENPVIITDNGIKLNPDKMVKEELYYCIYEDHVFLFFKDKEDILYCYEISDIDTINKIKQTPDNINEILNKLANDQTANISD